MNPYLHGVETDPSPIQSGVDSSAKEVGGNTFSVVLTNPPFGKKSSTASSNAKIDDGGEVAKDDSTYSRQDFIADTLNEQLDFRRHVMCLLKVGGRCAIVVPDNVLFEGGAGVKIRTSLPRTFDADFDKAVASDAHPAQARADGREQEATNRPERHAAARLRSSVSDPVGHCQSVHLGEAGLEPASTVRCGGF